MFLKIHKTFNESGLSSTDWKYRSHLKAVSNESGDNSKSFMK